MAINVAIKVLARSVGNDLFDCFFQLDAIDLQISAARKADDTANASHPHDAKIALAARVRFF